MRILLTNSTLDDRSGSETYLRDVAIAMRARGHEPVAYSPLLGEVAADLRAATIPVTNDLRSIRVAPDVIHGQHHLETMAALMHFENVPAIYVCHGWLPWQEAPPSHPRIRRYVAVDDTVRDRLVVESGIDPSRVRTLYNFVDLTRFRRRDAAPQLRRALIFNSRATEENLGAAVREACRQRGIAVDLVGYGADRPVREPESLLAQYDLVFARARIALEALVSGCAVCVADPTGMAGLVTAKNFESLRGANFGVRTLTNPVTVEALGAAIDEYDANDAGRVCERARAEADMDAVITAYEALYDEVRREPASSGDERAAFADYLRWLSLQTKLPGFVEWNRLKERCDVLALDNAALRSHLGDERELQVAEREVSERERRTRAEIAALRKRVDRMRRGPFSFITRLLRGR